MSKNQDAPAGGHKHSSGMNVILPYKHIRHAWTVINGIISPGLATSYILKYSRLRARMSIVVSCRAELVTFVVHRD